MMILRLLAIVVLTTVVTLCLAACGTTSDGHSTVKGTGRPVNPFTNPGGANQPSAPLTGAQPQHP